MTPEQLEVLVDYIEARCDDAMYMAQDDYETGSGKSSRALEKLRQAFAAPAAQQPDGREG